MKLFNIIAAVRLTDFLSGIYETLENKTLRQIKKLITTFELEFGHRRSFEEGFPIDKKGKPIPWFTYPAIEYLNQFDFRDCDVFEYGCGNGSLYWSGRAKSIITVENDSVWSKKIKKRIKKNQKLYLIEDKKAYINSIAIKRKEYDVIVIDGEHRKLCSVYAIKYIKSGGIIILDNSDWFIKAAETLRNAGLLQVDFSGSGPINYYNWTTLIFFTERAADKLMVNFRKPRPIGGRRIKIDDN